MICSRCCKQDLQVGHACPDDSKPCPVCGRSRIVVVVLHDARGFFSETQTCIGCLGPNKEERA
jgi:hypothetical protein